MGQLNTHSAASFYEVFPADEARRLAERLVVRRPKRGPGLNVVEVELNALGNRRPGWVHVATALRATSRPSNGTATHVSGAAIGSSPPPTCG
ncbi:MAG TPA: hypothetical protein VF170_10270 [Planctomycetaceae bacterium]